MASNQLSPGVVIQERDLTTTAVVPTANVGFIAGPFEQGPVEEIVDIVSEIQLIEKFGGLNDYNYEYWFTAANYLAYGGLLKVVRVTHSDLKNSVDQGTAPLIKNLDNYEGSFEEACKLLDLGKLRTPGTDGNSIGLFMTDAGPDQIAVAPAPGSGNEHEFVADAALTATASGAAGKVFKYSILLTVTTVVGTFVPGTSTTIDISGSNEAVTVLAWDAANKKLEIALPSGGVTGIIADGQTITQGTNTAVIGTAGVERRLYIIKDKGSIDFAATDSVTDTNSTAVVISSVREEYQEREYAPGAKWITVAARPGTSQYADSKGGHNDELHVLVVDIDGGITGTPGTLLERFLNVSKASDAKTTVGENNYYPIVIKQKSAYVYWGEHETDVHNANTTASDGNWGLSAARKFNVIRSAAGGVGYPNNDVAIGSKNNASYYYRLSSGASHSVASGFYNISNTDLAKSYDLIADREAVTVDFVLTGPTGATDTEGLSKVNTIKQVIDLRKDCIAFVSPRRGHVVGVTDPQVITDNIVDFFKTLPSKVSYMVFDSGYKYVYDKYNDKYRYIPCNSDIAGLCVQTTIQADPGSLPLVSLAV